MGMSFGQAESILNGKDSRKVGNNTYLVRLSADSIGVRHQRTVVVTINKDGTYILYTGGWKTVTTKERMNTYSPVGVYQKKREWYVSTSKGEIPFKDNMVVNHKGEVMS